MYVLVSYKQKIRSKNKKITSTKKSRLKTKKNFFFMFCPCSKRKVFTHMRLRSKDACFWWKCKSHLFCKGWYKSCDQEHPTCKITCCGNIEMKNFCFICLDEKWKYHTVFPCGHSKECVDCYNETPPFVQPNALEYGATESENDDEDLFTEKGKWFKRDPDAFQRFMKRTEEYDAKCYEWALLRTHNTCHVCRS